MPRTVFLLLLALVLPAGALAQAPQLVDRIVAVVNKEVITLSELNDAVASAPNVAVVSHEFWRTKLGGRREALGRAVVLDDRQYLVVGVMPEWFRYPLGNVSMWLPLAPGALTDAEQRQVNLVGRVRDGITPDAAKERVKQLGITAATAKL